jgi:hypothetical protein
LRRVCLSTGARSMSEFAREAVLASVETGNAPRGTLGGDLVTLTSRLHELDKVLKSATGLIGRVLGADPEHEAEERPREMGGAGSS